MTSAEAKKEAKQLSLAEDTNWLLNHENPPLFGEQKNLM